METQAHLSPNLSVKATTIALDLSRTSLYELLKKTSENFPRPYKIGRRTFFSKSEVAQWLVDRPRIGAKGNVDSQAPNQHAPRKGST